MYKISNVLPVLVIVGWMGVYNCMLSKRCRDLLQLILPQLVYVRRGRRTNRSRNSFHLPKLLYITCWTRAVSWDDVAGVAGCDWDVTTWRQWAQSSTCRLSSAETSRHCRRPSHEVDTGDILSRAVGLLLLNFWCSSWLHVCIIYIQRFAPNWPARLFAVHGVMTGG